MLEILVFIMCVHGYECTTMSKAYMQHNTTFRSELKVGTKNVIKYTGREAALMTAITYGTFVKHELRAKLPLRFVVQHTFKPEEPRNTIISWRYDF